MNSPDKSESNGYTMPDKDAHQKAVELTSALAEEQSKVRQLVGALKIVKRFVAGLAEKDKLDRVKAADYHSLIVETLARCPATRPTKFKDTPEHHGRGAPPRIPRRKK